MALRILGFFAVVVSMISHVIVLLAAIIYLLRLGHVYELHEEDEDQKELLDMQEHIWYMYLLIVMSLLGFFITCYMLYGFLSEEPHFVVPWLVFTFIYNVIILIMGIVLFHRDITLLKEFSIFIVNIVIMSIVFLNYQMMQHESGSRLSMRF